ncbi:alpha/beta hydrolase [Synoicihabitans lomoniglobus]|uniref:SAM-dependent chlorinase/fluorinase n=1 Tax=Synoicihabitans lomoniglobus TaxID=2909285 RepID=A0AAF0CPP8_9BACT|nr:SAM-dependent chlorinase/fluorinase [Opitutaceae bacterium LMO-M01]WED65766.1 SAM-dependent chlorinase/fluorinase [Opitutaceae bacterium LMO-M01]
MRRARLLLSCFAGTLIAYLPSRAEADLTTGTIDGAHYTIATPSHRPWNQQLVLIAHGYRPESAPLVADLFPHQSAYQTLIDEGWMVAKTSYRRNGIIVADAITDLDQLLAHINATYGPTNRVILMGDSMGGTIATHLAERGGDDYDGLIAIGAALELREHGDAHGLNLAPQLPLLFVANRSEFDGPRNYLNETSAREGVHLVSPVLFRIDRDGHVNVNQAERLFAIRAMNSWLDRGRPGLPHPVLDKFFDATQRPNPGLSQVAIDADARGLTAKVTEVSAIYGNVFLNLQPADMAAIGWTEGLWAELIVGDQTFRVRHGRDFDSVERGEWVVFPNADGFTWLSRNWGNAAETANLHVGSEIHLRRFPASN